MNFLMEVMQLLKDLSLIKRYQIKIGIILSIIEKVLRGKHLELWQHLSGCRQWIKVERDTATHEIFRTLKANEDNFVMHQSYRLPDVGLNR